MVEEYKNYLLEMIDKIHVNNKKQRAVDSKFLINEYYNYGYNNLSEACEKMYWILEIWNETDEVLLSYSEFARDIKLNQLLH